MRIQAAALAVIAAIALSACAGRMKSDDPEFQTRWVCHGDLTLYARPGLFDNGKVIMGGQEIVADHAMQGIKNVWRWGVGELEGEPDTYRYAITVTPGTYGESAYYFDHALDDDGDGIVENSTSFRCYDL